MDDLSDILNDKVMSTFAKKKTDDKNQKVNVNMNSINSKEEDKEDNWDMDNLDDKIVSKINNDVNNGYKKSLHVIPIVPPGASPMISPCSTKYAISKFDGETNQAYHRKYLGSNNLSALGGQSMSKDYYKNCFLNKTKPFYNGTIESPKLINKMDNNFLLKTYDQSIGAKKYSQRREQSMFN